MSVFKKIKSLAKNGIKPVQQGIDNYHIPVQEIEELAKNRSESCVDCENYIDEPIDFMAVEDKRIPVLSNKMCDNCGCALPYVLRQNIKICKHWK